MLKNCFILEYTNGSKEEYFPKELESSGLEDLDSFTLNFNTIDELAKKISKDLNQFNIIEKILILNKRTGTEYKIITGNKYFKGVFNNLKEKDIKGPGYIKTVKTVSINSRPYLEMQKFLYDNLANNSERFFKEIYNRDNEFSRLLNKFTIANKRKDDSEEDYYNFRDLMDEVDNNLSIYKNYRSLAISRQTYENKNKYTQTPTKEFKTVDEMTDIYNYENDEYLTGEEFEQMVGPGNDYKRRY